MRPLDLTANRNHRLGRCEGEPGRTIWDKAQRCWPFTRMMSTIEQIPSYSPRLAEHPSSFRDDAGIQVRLENVKQGTYHSQPASLLLLEINWTVSSYFPLSCFSIRISSLDKKIKGSGTPTSWHVAAYAPAEIVEIPGVSSRWPADGRAIPGAIDIQTTEHGLQVNARPRSYQRTGVPRVINFGFVLVHHAPVQLRIFPSVTHHRRFSIFLRTKIWPLIVDSMGELYSIGTCDNQQEGGCHPSCNDFGPGHMTPARWKSILARLELKAFRGKPDESAWGRNLPLP